MGDLFGLVFYVPQLILAIVGVILIARSRRGGATTMGVIGCILIAIHTVLGALQGFVLPRLMDSFGMSITTMFMIVGSISMVIFCAGFMLLILSAAKKPSVQGPAYQPGPPQGGWQGQQPGYPQQGQPQAWPQQQQPPQNQQWQQQPPQQYGPPPGQGY